MVLLPKSNGEFRGGRLFEFIWKALLGVVNQRVGVAVQFHDVHKSFRESLGVGLTSL